MPRRFPLRNAASEYHLATVHSDGTPLIWKFQTSGK
jgi:hypothetical protein